MDGRRPIGYWRKLPAELNPFLSFIFANRWRSRTDVRKDSLTWRISLISSIYGCTMRISVLRFRRKCSIDPSFSKYDDRRLKEPTTRTEPLRTEPFLRRHRIRWFSKIDNERSSIANGPPEFGERKVSVPAVAFVDSLLWKIKRLPSDSPSSIVRL